MAVQMMVGEDGSLKIPAALRQQTGIKEGDLVTLKYDGTGTVLIEAVEADAIQAKTAIGQAVSKIVDAESWLESAARLFPDASTTFLDLVQRLHKIGVEALESRHLLEKGEN